jgi:hypothetical protein
MTGKLPRKHGECGRKEGEKSDAMDLALPKIRTLAGDKIRRKKIWV